MTSLLLAGDGGLQDDASWCIDAAGMASTTNYVPVRLAGFRGQSGYTAGRYAIAREHLEAWWEMGGWWMLNYELNPYAGLGGAELGHRYAQDFLQIAADLGHQGETALIFSLVDFGPTASQFPILDETHERVVVDLLDAGRDPGFYLPPVYGRHVAVQPWWPATGVLWQWAGAGDPEWWTTVKQHYKPMKDVSGIPFAVDENYVHRPMLVWTGYGEDPQPSTGVTMRQFVRNAEPFPPFVDDYGQQQVNGGDPGGVWPATWLVFEIVPGGKQHVSGDEWFSLTNGTGQPDSRVGFVEDWPTGRIQQMPNAPHPGVAAPAKPVDLSSVKSAAQGVQAAAAQLVAAIDAL